ncbi:hypothetical protein Q2K19_11080 [Micromonospora soli]|uniref:hypothetical protein n=1 Tax=Micromonospora sp. NBRC 110009 TaxID=3061627 RepID=UPI00267221FE|nr:hypothetical protein [Micromonospora sp. NBRC 110009]WKU00977.1 hypothetical protein Q2K19_11080 [Micromonospora sp. NBRC 110009]
MADVLPTSRPPRGPVLRTLIAGLLVVAVTVPPVIISEMVRARVGAGPLVDLAWVTVPAVMVAWLAPRASYRRRDVLLCLLGPVVLYFFVIIAWRVAYLPFRDWAPRPDEKPRAHWLRDAQHTGTWYLDGEAK